MDELEAVPFQRQLPEERRAWNQWVDCGADVVNEARSRELGRARTAPYRVGPLENQNRQPLARDRDRRGQPVGSRADDDRVVAALDQRSCPLTGTPCPPRGRSAPRRRSDPPPPGRANRTARTARRPSRGACTRGRRSAGSAPPPRAAASGLPRLPPAC